ncbi:MAG TPA: alpha/beta hydrolase [Polyangiaceae bacterium]|nr:alpha/beta hydrolase [Polyangiaceae bacterium]
MAALKRTPTTSTTDALRIAVSDGVTLHCTSTGSGAPVLLLHGFPETRRSWDLQVPALVAQGYRAITCDLRGYGESDKPKSGYDLTTLARDVERLIDQLGAPVRVVGHDWGGAIAWQLFETCPEKLFNVTVINCPHPRAMTRALLRNPRQRKRSWYMFFFQLPLLPERWLRARDGRNLSSLFRAGSPGHASVPPALIAEQTRTLLAPDGLRGPLAYYRTAFQLRPSTVRALRAPLRKSTRPVTLIWGEADSCLGMELIDGSERFAPNLRVELVPNAGHFVHQERPDVVNELLLAALTRTEGDA